MGDKPRHLLDGYKVLDFTHFVAGPTTTRLMAGMGAEIIKVELAPHGDHAREFDDIRDRRSAFFVQQNRGKQSLCVDLRKPAGLRARETARPSSRRCRREFRSRRDQRHGAWLSGTPSPQAGDRDVLDLGAWPDLAQDAGFDFISSARRLPE